MWKGEKIKFILFWKKKCTIIVLSVLCAHKFVALPAYSISNRPQSRYKEEKLYRSGLRCGSVETCRNVSGVSLSGDEAH